MEKVVKPNFSGSPQKTQEDLARELGIRSVMCDVHTYNNDDEILQDLAFYIESGIFKESVDFTYTFSEGKLLVSIGGKSPHCNQTIKVTVQMKEGITREILEKAIKKVEE